MSFRLSFRVFLIVCGWRVFCGISLLSCGHIYYEHTNFRPSNTAKHAAFQCVCMLCEFCQKVTLWRLDPLLVKCLSPICIHSQVRGYHTWTLVCSGRQNCMSLHFRSCISFTCIWMTINREPSIGWRAMALFFNVFCFVSEHVEHRAH